MPHTKKYIALDLGGSSGRCVVGSFDGEKLCLNIVSRFDNSYVRVMDHLYWDVLRLFAMVKHGLRQAQNTHGTDLVSIGVDTWGVAFALLDGKGSMIGNPLYNRIPQTEAIVEYAFGRMPPEEIFRTTGLQLSRLNSLYLLLEMVTSDSPALKIAQTFLMMPDLINYWLTGRTACEYTIASTSHLLDAQTKQWAYPLIEAMGVPTHIFPEIIKPGQVLEKLHHTIAEETGLQQVPVVATACHDTAAAIASVPAKVDHYAYLSSGTWGLLGTELSQPMLTEKVLQHNFANEGGVSNTIRLLHNSVNLWLVQECRRIWAMEGQDYSWDELVKMSEQVKPFIAFINPHAPEFLLPENMPGKVREVCQQTGQSMPQTKGEIIRVILESLAFKYRYTLEKLVDILEKKPQVLHIVGGGGRNKMLSQFCANAINLPVITGPYEATAVGNIIMQMIAVGDLASLEEGRELVSVSFPTETYSPLVSDVWEEQYRKYLEVIGLPSII